MDEFEHPTLGLFKPQAEEGWLGRSGPNADFYDLFVMRAADEATPQTSALTTLADAAAQIATLKRDAVAHVCAAREARLGWRRGPEADQWSVVEARVDADGVFWLTLHEYETDEYSRWLVRMSGEFIVRRIPALALSGAPSEAGVRV